MHREALTLDLRLLQFGVEDVTSDHFRLLVFQVDRLSHDEVLLLTVGLDHLHDGSIRVALDCFYLAYRQAAYLIDFVAAFRSRNYRLLV